MWLTQPSGFSYPQNLELAYELEEAVRSSGGIPATVAVLDGVARVGLTKSELTSLIERAGPRKVSRRDLGFTTGLVLLTWYFIGVTRCLLWHSDARW